MLAYTFYESDNRVMRYAEALVGRGDKVDVIALRKVGQSNYDIIDGVNVYRIQERKVNEKGRCSYLYRILKFLVKSAAFVSWKYKEQRYELIHVHSVPDFEVFTTIIPKFFGAKVILDIHDIVPEFYVSKFKTTKGSFLYKSLILAERVSCIYSDHIIISNHIWEKRLLKRSVKKEKCTVILNYPDEIIFFKQKQKKEDRKFIAMYPGTLNRHQGIDLAVRAVAKIKEQVPNLEFHIYGDGPSKDFILGLVEDLGLKDVVLLKHVVPIKEIAQIMATADLGIIPKRNDSFGGEAFSTKSLEFMAVGVPIIISRTKIDDYYFNDSIVKFFEPENVDDLAKAILEMYNNKALRERLAQNALKFVEDFKWEKNKHIYLNIVDSLVKRKK